jgi:hypothetical protein
MAASHGYLGAERRRHFRVEGEWPVQVGAVEQSRVSEFEGLALNVSMSGLLLETAVSANLHLDKELRVMLPGGVGEVDAIVRRFLAYGEGGHKRTRWGIELREMSVQQRAHWARFIFSEAHRLGQSTAHKAFLQRRSGGSAAS